MPEGKCELCEKTKLLQKSHFLPKSIYKAMGRAARKGTNLIIRDNNGDAYPIAQQITRHFLCSTCEDLLNKGGEEYFVEAGVHPKKLTLSEIMEIGKATGNQFTEDDFGPPEVFQELVKSVRNIYQQDKDGLKLKASFFSNIDSQKLYYFAISMIWKGGHDVWLKYKPLTIESVSLKKMAEYLTHDSAQFPAVKVTVAPTIKYQTSVTVLPVKISDGVIYFSILFYDFFIQLGEKPSSLDDAVMYDFTNATTEKCYSIKTNLIEKSNKRGKANNIDIDNVVDRS